MSNLDFNIAIIGSSSHTRYASAYTAAKNMMFIADSFTRHSFVNVNSNIIYNYTKKAESVSADKYTKYYELDMLQLSRFGSDRFVDMSRIKDREFIDAGKTNLRLVTVGNNIVTTFRDKTVGTRYTKGYGCYFFIVIDLLEVPSIIGRLSSDYITDNHLTDVDLPEFINELAADFRDFLGVIVGRKIDQQINIVFRNASTALNMAGLSLDKIDSEKLFNSLGEQQFIRLLHLNFSNIKYFYMKDYNIKESYSDSFNRVYPYLDMIMNGRI